MGVALLVGVDEDEVERRRAGHRGETVARRPDADIDPIRHPRTIEICARDAGVRLLDLQRHQLAVFGQRAREPDRRIAAERPDFEDAAGARDLREQEQHLALRRRNVDRRQAIGLVVRKRSGERVVIAEQFPGDIGIDGSPAVAHQATEAAWISSIAPPSEASNAASSIEARRSSSSARLKLAMMPGFFASSTQASGRL